MEHIPLYFGQTPKTHLALSIIVIQWMWCRELVEMSFSLFQSNFLVSIWVLCFFIKQYNFWSNQINPFLLPIRTQWEFPLGLPIINLKLKSSLLFTHNLHCRVCDKAGKSQRAMPSLLSIWISSHRSCESLGFYPYTEYPKARKRGRGGGTDRKKGEKKKSIEISLCLWLLTTLSLVQYFWFSVTPCRLGRLWMSHPLPSTSKVPLQ